jgi:hypothetical protein
MKRPQGPDLKIPDVKVPRFVMDVYYDLRDRRLLPLMALVVVAIAAVPFLLGGDTEEVQPPSSGDTAQSSIAAPEARLTVVEAKPGLRDYRRRLRRRSPTDPFKQRYTSLPEEAQLKSVEVTPTGDVAGSSVESVPEIGESVTEVDETDAAPDAGGNGGAPAPSGGARGPDDGLQEGRLYGFRPDLRFGVAGSDALTLYRELPLGKLLPAENPVLLFIGVTQNGKRALFSLTPEVSLVRGDGDCIGGARSCSLLSIQAGQAVDVLTDQPGRTFRLRIERIEFVQIPTPQGKQSSRAPAGGKPSDDWRRGLSQSFTK